MNQRLERCGPLNDAVQIAVSFLKWNMFLALVMGSLVTAVIGMMADDGSGDSLYLIPLGMAGVGLLVSLPMIGAMALLAREKKDKQYLCLLLRAFRSDEHSDQMRAWLKAALGSDFKLSGIRPPRERAAWMTTLLSPLLTGLRYLGSRQFELEAPDHNWMARLLASFGRSRLVFVDVRDVTTHVLDEIRLAWQVFGPQRTIFIINDSRSTEEWQAVIAGHVGESATLDGLKLLVWPAHGEPAPSDFTRNVQAVVADIPTSRPTIPSQAMDYVEQRVGEGAWDSGWTERPSGIIFASILVGSVFSFLLAMISEHGEVVLAVAVSSLLQLFYWRAWWRAFKQRRFAKRINPQGPPSARRLWGSAILMLIFLYMMAAIILSAFFTVAKLQGRASSLRAQMEVKQLSMAVRMYEIDNARPPWLSAEADYVIDIKENASLLATLAGTDPDTIGRRADYLSSPPQTILSRLVDEWGTPLRLAVDANNDDQVNVTGMNQPVSGSMVALSAGRDKTWDTEDDQVLESY